MDFIVCFILPVGCIEMPVQKPSVEPEDFRFDKSVCLMVSRYCACNM